MEMSSGAATCLFIGIHQMIEGLQKKLDQFRPEYIAMTLREIEDGMAFYASQWHTSQILQKDYAALTALLAERSAAKEVAITDETEPTQSANIAGTA